MIKGFIAILAECETSRHPGITYCKRFESQDFPISNGIAIANPIDYFPET